MKLATLSTLVLLSTASAASAQQASSFAELDALISSSTANAASAQHALPALELDQQRGGVLIAGDVAFEFGAMIRTYADNELALETRLVWTADGPVVDQSQGLADVAGTVTHLVNGGQIANVLTNTESGKTFRQETDVTITLPGFADAQANIARNIGGIRLGDDLAIGSIRALSGQ